MSDIPPRGTQLGTLRILESLINFDGPKLFTCANEFEDVFIAVFIDDDDESETYLYAPVTQDRLVDVTTGYLPLRAAFEDPDGTHVYAVKHTFDAPDVDVQEILASRIPDEWLPEPKALIRPTAVMEDGSSTVSSDAVLVGRPAGILFELDSSTLAGDSSASFQVSLRLSVADRLVWGSPDEDGAVLVNAAEFLQFLSANWVRIMWEEWPLDELPLAALSRLRAEVSSIRQTSSLSDRRTFEAVWEDFVSAHDLARGASKAALPSVIIARQGRYGWLITEAGAHQFDIDDVLSDLESFGEALEGALSEFESDSDVRRARTAWADRLELPSASVARIVSGLPRRIFQSVRRESHYLSEEIETLPISKLIDSELLAAARLSAGLAPRHIAQVLDQIGDPPRVETPELDDHSNQALKLIEDYSFPFDKGLAAARWLREELGMPLDVRVDPADVLRRYGIEVHNVSLVSTTVVDAVAVWGPQRGPAVFVNTSGRRARRPAGYRTSVAHELAHLLLDRRGARPVADVLRGSQSGSIEARARAFAAQFLLPQETAAAAFEDDSANPRAVVNRLSSKYLVGKELVAWHIRNAVAELDDEARIALSRFVQRPERY